MGVLQAAADEGIFSIGVDSNQNYLHPGQVLTSMMKRVDNAVYDAMKAGTDLETGINVMGIANGGIGYALDEHNAELVSADMVLAGEVNFVPSDVPNKFGGYTIHYFSGG